MAEVSCWRMVRKRRRSWMFVFYLELFERLRFIDFIHHTTHHNTPHTRTDSATHLPHQNPPQHTPHTNPHYTSHKHAILFHAHKHTKTTPQQRTPLAHIHTQFHIRTQHTHSTHRAYPNKSASVWPVCDSHIYPTCYSMIR